MSGEDVMLWKKIKIEKHFIFYGSITTQGSGSFQVTEEKNIIKL